MFQKKKKKYKLTCNILYFKQYYAIWARIEKKNISKLIYYAWHVSKRIKNSFGKYLFEATNSC